MPLHYLITQKDDFLSFLKSQLCSILKKANLVYLFFRSSIYGSTLSILENMGKGEFYQTVSYFFFSSVSYFNTIYSNKSKKKKKKKKKKDNKPAKTLLLVKKVGFNNIYI